MYACSSFLCGSNLLNDAHMYLGCNLGLYLMWVLNVGWVRKEVPWLLCCGLRLLVRTVRCWQTPPLGHYSTPKGCWPSPEFVFDIHNIHIWFEISLDLAMFWRRHMLICPRGIGQVQNLCLIYITYTHTTYIFDLRFRWTWPCSGVVICVAIQKATRAGLHSSEDHDCAGGCASEEKYGVCMHVQGTQPQGNVLILY